MIPGNDPEPWGLHGRQAAETCGTVVGTSITASQAQALASGFLDYAKDTEIAVIRTPGAESSMLKFNYRM